MISISDLKKSFGHFDAVRGLSFDVQKGEVLGFLGPNGAGKSTTMKMITGFLSPTSGQIKVGDYEVGQDDLEIAKLIGYLPEGAPAYGDMTTERYLCFIAEVRGIEKSKITERVQHVIEQLALESVRHRSIDELSKGFKRRVGIAQALIHDPQILIMDEPTDGLDPNQKHQVRQLIKNLSDEKIVIISTHILEEVAAVCSRALVIAQGQLVADGTPAELEAKSRYHGAVSIRVGSDDVFEQLQNMHSVKAVEEDTGRFTLFPKDKTESDVYNELKSLASEQDWDVKELYVEQGRLDDVFRALTAQTQQQEVA